MSAKHDVGDPVQAFEELRAEVCVLRKAVEALPDALERNRAPDYGPDFGVLGQGMDAIGDILEKFQKHPALRMTPEQHSAAIAGAGRGLIREAAEKLDQTAQDTDRERHRLLNAIGAVRSKSNQRLWLAIAMATGMISGFVVFPFMMRAMPVSINSVVAAAIMHSTKWDAGIALMKAGDPEGWSQFVSDAELISANRGKVGICRAAAAHEKREQRCTIVISRPYTSNRSYRNGAPGKL